MHVLPRVAELEERFADVLVAIGVHSGKFVEERKTPNIRLACDRLGVRHPVVNDRQYRIWRGYAVQAWPSVALISPDGRLVGAQAGEFDTAAMAGLIERMVARYESEGSLRRGRLEFGVDPEAPGEPAGELRYPTRAIADGERLYVSDAGHRRVLELSAEEPGAAVVARAFGSGATGFEDGPGEYARFREPQGLALHDGTLYVADRANHAVRAVDLATGLVTTIAGNGELGARVTEGPGRSSTLRSPWGLAAAGDTLLVTMAGSHQLWAVDLSRTDFPISLMAGAGGENITDGPRERATLAQPSGLTTSGGRLLFADSESSAVRSVDPGPDGEVRTVVGTGLFQFGDKDGTGDEAMLQHDLDIAAYGDLSLVADTYNSKIKVIDAESRRCEALPGPAGSGDALFEPSGISVSAEGRVLVADTNHHRVCALDPATGELTTIEVRAFSRTAR